MKASVGPTAEMLAYGDGVFTQKTEILHPKQFRAAKPVVAQASDDNGWIGPLGSTTMHSTAGSLYGYGVPADNPQY